MFDVLLKAFSFAFIVVIGILMKKTGLAEENAGEVIKKVLLYITMPAAVIVNFSSISDVSVSMLLAVVLGISTNIIMIAVAAVMTRKKSKGEQALQMLCLPAYNIGAFGLPFIQYFLPGLGSVTACMFDVGNSIMCGGGTYVFVSEYIAEHKTKINIKSLAGLVSSSPPLIVYVVMFLLTLTGVRLPERFQQFLSPISTANIFIAMLMLGLTFRFELKRSYIKKIIEILLLRSVFSVVFALAFYMLLPFSLVMRQSLVLLCFAPVSAIAPVYTGMCGGDEGLASCISSISIFLSLILMTALVTWFGLK